MIKWIVLLIMNKNNSTFEGSASYSVRNLDSIIINTFKFNQTILVYA